MINWRFFNNMTSGRLSAYPPSLSVNLFRSHTSSRPPDTRTSSRHTNQITEMVEMRDITGEASIASRREQSGARSTRIHHREQR